MFLFMKTFEKLFFFLKGRLLAVLRRVKLENEKRKESQKEAKNEEAKLEKAQQEDSTEKEESSLFGEDLPEEGENQEGSIANNIKKITYEDGSMANGFNGLKKKKMALRQFQGKDMKRRKNSKEDGDCSCQSYQERRRKRQAKWSGRKRQGN